MGFCYNFFNEECISMSGSNKVSASVAAYRMEIIR